MNQSEKWLSKTERKIYSEMGEAINGFIKFSLVQSSIHLEGSVKTYDDVLKAGYIAAKMPFREVVNDLVAENDPISIMNHKKMMHIKDNLVNQTEQNVSNTNQANQANQQTIPCDVLIIGAGIVGTSIARELSKYQLDIYLIDKAYDVAVHTSSRNDGMIHPGIAAPTKSLKCKLNIRGNKLYEKISEQLDVPIRWCGSLILFRSHLTKVSKLFFKIKAKQIGMEGLKFLNQKEVYEKEPNLEKGVVWGVLCERSGVTSPYKMTVAYAENAIQNGVKLMLNTEVKSMCLEEQNIHTVKTNNGVFSPKIIINAAGVYADFIAQMADDRYFSIHPRKGEIVLFDKKKGHLVNGILGFVGDRSSKNTKSGGIIKTYEGNLLVGPNAIETSDRENYETHLETVRELLDQKLPQIKGMKKEDDITYFTGIRAATYKEDFIIEKSSKISNLIHVAGIQSPGFASAPAIAERVEQIVVEMYQQQKQSQQSQQSQQSNQATQNQLIRKDNWNPIRKAIPDLASMNLTERNQLIQENPAYGEIICRCEEISKGEIIDALKSPIPVDTVDGIKRRVRAGMGRCQGGFCMPLVIDIIHDVKGIPRDEVTKKSGISKIAVQETKLGNR